MPKLTKTQGQNLAFAGDLLEAAQRIAKEHNYDIDGGDFAGCLLGMAAGAADGVWTEDDFAECARRLFVDAGRAIAAAGDPS